MKIKVTSMIPWRTDLSGDFEIEDNIKVKEFLEDKQIAWDQEALVIVNDQIVNDAYILKEGDHVHLLVPVVGG